MEAQSRTCLNCEATLIGTYCHRCSQKADTHRITLPHLVQHDLVHGIWHFDKGLLFTLREALLRPGYMAVNYIKGKRIRYYNVFYLILIMLGINALAAHYFKQYLHITEKESVQGLVIEKDSVNVSYYVDHYFKLILFFMIPLFALGGMISFRKMKFNFAEHAIIGGSLLLTGAIAHFFFSIGLYSSVAISAGWFNYVVWALAIWVMLQPVRVYYQVVRGRYSIFGFLLHTVQWFSCIALFLFLGLLVIALFTGKTNITLS